MFRSIITAACAVTALGAPALAATGPTVDQDFVCFAMLATAEYGVRSQLEDPKTAADQRESLTNARDLLRRKGDWYLARITTLPPEKRTMAHFDTAAAAIKAMESGKRSETINACINGVEIDRKSALDTLLSK